MKKLCGASVILLVTVVGIAHPQPSEPLRSPFYPLEIGHKWTYRVTDLRAVQPKADPKRKVVVEVDREENYNRTIKDPKGGADIVQKSIGYLLKSTSGGKITLDHVIVLPEGIHKIHVAGTPINPPLLFFKLGVKPGESWTCDSVSGNKTIKGTFTGKSEKVAVPHGEFDAFVVSFHNNVKGDDRIEVDYWFAQGAGMVKQRVLAKNHEILLELERFDKAK